MTFSVFSVRVLFLLLALSLPSIRPLFAQVVEGHLLEAETRTPIPMGSVALLDTAMVELRQVTTDERGRFRLEAPGPGRYFVLAEALGYKRTLDGVLEMEDGGRISVDFFLRPEPIEMDSLSVEAERHRIVQHLELQGFYDRRAAGFGHFISHEEIEERNVRDFNTLLRKLPNLQTTGVGIGGTRLSMQWLGGSCSPAVWVNGVLADPRWDKDAAGSLEEVLSVDDVISVEWYDGPASVPLQWGGTALKRPCGVIVFWTKGG